MARYCSAMALLLAVTTAAWADDAIQPVKKALVLPGVGADGAVRLTNSWKINPVGRQLGLGDLPVNIALHPSGKWLAILHAGYGEHEIVLVEIGTKRSASPAG